MGAGVTADGNGELSLYLLTDCKPWAGAAMATYLVGTWP